jgi:carbamoyltransferase
MSKIPQRIARLLADGNPVAWFQGRMEFGPAGPGRPFHPGLPQRAGRGRPHQRTDQVPRTLAARSAPVDATTSVGPKMLQSEHPAPYMTFTFEVAEEWKTRVPEVVHEDGTSRAQVLKRERSTRATMT